tara:strand:- start:35 stop:601 length:567 start_codon:yes stop_codon:yes gene_type:complete
MLKGLSNINGDDLIIYIHTKTNNVIRKNIMKVLSIKLDNQIIKNDAFFTNKYYSLCNDKIIKEKHNFYYIKEICKITDKKYYEHFKYYPISFFAYKARFIDCIFKNIDKLISMCSFKHKKCSNWLKLMNDKDNYKIYGIKKIYFKNNYFSTMIHEKNLGIPNGCFEHGLERFIGGILLKDVKHIYNFI